MVSVISYTLIRYCVCKSKIYIHIDSIQIQYMVNIMRKSLFIIAPVAFALLAGIGPAQAASNAEITITANVVAATCDVSISKSNLDLGNYSKTQFTTAATPIAGSVKTFTLDLSNCEDPKAADSVAGLTVTGQTLSGNTNIFNSTGTNTGIMLSLPSSPSTYITAGETVDFANTATTAADLNGQTLTLQAGLATTSTTAPDIGQVSAPVLFSFVYN